MININVADNDRFVIIVIGCGGTGSQLLSPLFQLLNDTKKANKVILVDADIIERKNTRNQKFIEEEIGYNKAYTLASRYTYLFDEVNIESYEEYITTPIQINQLIVPYQNAIIVGAVDNNATRKVIHDYFIRCNHLSNLIYIDSGNGTDIRSGQIVIGYKQKDKVLLNDVGNIFEDVRNTKEDIKEVGTCMRISNEKPQNSATNLFAAANIYNVITNIIMFKKIQSNIIFFDADKCSAYSR